MDLLHLVLGFAVVFAAVLYILDEFTEYVPDYLGISGPIILIHSKVGFALVEKIASYREEWKRIGSVGIIVCFVGMVLAVFGIGTSAVSVLLRPEQTQITQPTNYLAIPGVNDFLPMTVAVEIILALLVGVVIHEGAHAILCRVEDIDLESTGLVFLSFIPMGAFVEPDEVSKEKATRIGRMRMASAGILSNLALTIVSVLAVVIIASTAITAVQGGAIGSIYDGSPADESSLESGEVITTINGEEIQSNEQLTQYLQNTETERITVTTASGESHTITRSLFVEGVQNELVPVGTEIAQVEGEQVSTVAEFREIATQQSTVQLKSEEGESYVIPAGGQVQVEVSGEEQIAYITSVDNTRTLTGDEVTNELGENKQEVIYYTVSDDGVTENTAQLTEESVIESYDGVAGISFDDTGIVSYPAEQFLAVLQFSDEISLFQGAVLWFVLPLGQLIPGLSFNFPGFTGANMGFYETAIGGLGEPIIFFIVTAFFWMAWMNFNLALFNCLPIWALDGNHVLRDGLRELDARIERPAATPALKTLEYGIPLTILLLFLVVLFAPFIITML